MCKIASFFGINPQLIIGGISAESTLKNDMMRLSVKNGGTIRIVCKIPRTNVILCRKREILNKEKIFDITLHQSCMLFPSILTQIDQQVSNIPDYLDNLVLTVGAGTQLFGIVSSLNKYKKKVKNIYCIGCLGKTKKIIDNLCLNMEKHLPEKVFNIRNSNIIPVDTDFNAVTKVKESVDSSIFLDPIYEAKRTNGC